MPKDTPSTQSQEAASKDWRRMLRRWVPACAAFCILAVLGIIILQKLRNDVWAYFTDEEGTRVEVQDEKARFVLWEDPKNVLFDSKNAQADPEQPEADTNKLEAAFSPNGTMMVLVILCSSMAARVFSALKRARMTEHIPAISCRVPDNGPV